MIWELFTRREERISIHSIVDVNIVVIILVESTENPLVVHLETQLTVIAVIVAEMGHHVLAI